MFFALLTINQKTNAQFKSFQLNANGDTINAINNAGQKVGKWVIEVPELRGEPGYVEEGIYKKGEKDGYWRRYSTMGDLIAIAKGEMILVDPSRIKEESKMVGHHGGLEAIEVAIPLLTHQN